MWKAAAGSAITGFLLVVLAVLTLDLFPATSEAMRIEQEPTCEAKAERRGCSNRCGNGVVDTDRGEQCDEGGAINGTSNSCCTNSCEFVAVGTECAASQGECDLPETCTGSTASCPLDGPNLTTECRPAPGQCDVPEFCGESSDDCPTDLFEPANVMCIGIVDGGPCDGADFCSGTDDTCVDGFTTGNVCRNDTGQCDVEETCDGSGSACPADGFEPSTTPCSGAANSGPCDGEDFCSGTDGSCMDGFTTGNVCRTDTGACDVEETCDGTASDCPADIPVPAEVCPALLPTLPGGGAGLSSDVCVGDVACNGTMVVATCSCRNPTPGQPGINLQTGCFEDSCPSHPCQELCGLYGFVSAGFTCTSTSALACPY